MSKSQHTVCKNRPDEIKAGEPMAPFQCSRPPLCLASPVLAPLKNPKTSLSAMPKIAREGLSIIHTILGLRNAQPVTPSFADVVLVSIDTENTQAMISAVIDTYFIADEVFGPGSGPRSLSGLLRSLGRPCSQYHSAGNDANYALMALLLLAIRGLAKEDADAKRIMVRLLRKVSIFQSTTL